MFEDIDAKFNTIINGLYERHGNVEIVTKAYNLAKELHKNQTRKEGIPYIDHPVEVAKILANLGFNEDVICAALLHDTVEDCDYSIEQMKIDFNDNIAQMVDCVSAIDKTKYIYDKEEIYEDKKFIKSSVEEQTFKKLISIGKKNSLGFCIKFADRLHNLRTIDCFEYPKQLEKVRETEKWVLPIAKALKAQYFYIEIKNECFKIVNKFNGKNFFEQYNYYHRSNASHIENLLKELKIILANTEIKDIFIDELSERKVFDKLSRIKKIIRMEDISQGQILKVENYVIYMIYKDGLDSQSLLNTTLANINKSAENLKIVDAKIGNFSEFPYFVIRDSIRNYYRLYILSSSDYQKLKIGTLDGRYNDIIDEDNINNLDIDTIKVKTRSGETKIIAKNSTVLDFAFKIHQDIGFAFKFAIINDSKTKFPPYTRLNENDKVEIIVEKDENGNMVNNSKLRWLAYVNTEFAKKILIKRFENIYN